MVKPRECSATNLIINYGIQTRVHIDGLNVSPSWICSVGQFRFGKKEAALEAGAGNSFVFGDEFLGDLWVHEENPTDRGAAFRMQCPENKMINNGLRLAAGRSLNGVAVPVRHRWHEFDARNVHATLPTEAEKMSSV
eukprot:g9022.t1